MTLETQDELVVALTSELSDSRIVDRRKTPMFGYRAVHVVARVEGFPVEIQVRTESQDDWAQVMEELADGWGRGIRYGDPPIGANDAQRAKRAEMVREWQRIGETFAATEQAETEAAATGRRADELEARFKAGEAHVRDEMLSAMREAASLFRRAGELGMQAAEELKRFGRALANVE